MADFCFQCTEKFLGLEGKENDFKDLISEEEVGEGLLGAVLCEGCGAALVDHKGNCHSTFCLEKHGVK